MALTTPINLIWPQKGAIRGRWTGAGPALPAVNAAFTNRGRQGGRCQTPRPDTSALCASSPSS